MDDRKQPPPNVELSRSVDENGRVIVKARTVLVAQQSFHLSEQAAGLFDVLKHTERKVLGMLMNEMGRLADDWEAEG